jgi:WhiB family redox-sensing transcriptional regulator
MDVGKYQLNWRQGSACLTAEPDIFFATGSGTIDHERSKKAKALCQVCPVRINCLVYGLYLQYHQAHKIDGYWGGIDEKMRKKILIEYEGSYGKYKDRIPKSKVKFEELIPHNFPKEFFDEIIDYIALIGNNGSAPRGFASDLKKSNSAKLKAAKSEQKMIKDGKNNERNAKVAQKIRNIQNLDQKTDQKTGLKV